MIQLKISSIIDLQKYSSPMHQVVADNHEEKVKLLIVRDLLRSDWTFSAECGNLVMRPPSNVSKSMIKETLSIKRNEILSRDRAWIDKNINVLRNNLIDGRSLNIANIDPVFEVCETQCQHDLFRICRYYWSSAYSEYVGRRLKFIIRDMGQPNHPIIGIAALGSPIIHIPARDEWIGWDTKTRTKNLNYCMDAYVLGAMPPYNHLLGGKLISYMLASNEIRKIFSEKYTNTFKELACIFTTSLYGNSSQYNRIKYNGSALYNKIGVTKGFGTLHLSEETFTAMVAYLKDHGVYVMNNFGDGPSWRMRVIRTVGRLLKFNPDSLLKHTFKRGIYAIPLAHNYSEFLNGDTDELDSFNYPVSDLVDHWKNRWLMNRKNNDNVLSEVMAFNTQAFKI